MIAEQERYQADAKVGFGDQDRECKSRRQHITPLNEQQIEHESYKDDARCLADVKRPVDWRIDRKCAKREETVANVYLVVKPSDDPARKDRAEIIQYGPNGISDGSVQHAEGKKKKSS